MLSISYVSRSFSARHPFDEPNEEWKEFDNFNPLPQLELVSHQIQNLEQPAARVLQSDDDPGLPLPSGQRALRSPFIN